MDLEKAVLELQEKLAKAELELEREKAVTEIQNVIANYTYYHSGGRHKESLEQFALLTPDVSCEIAMWGKYVGPRSVYNNYMAMAKHEGERIGVFCDHPVATPLIVVSDDCLTAKCMWTTWGVETGFNPNDPNAPPAAEHMYGKYACEFIKENGRWKMWHFHIMPDMRYNQLEPFTEYRPKSDPTQDNFGRPTFDPEFGGPDEETTYCEEYSADRARKFWPQPPERYETYKGSKPVVGKPPEDSRYIFKSEYNDISFEDLIAEIKSKL